MSVFKRLFDVSLDEIQQSWLDVRDDSVDTNWILLNYSNEGRVVLAGKGTKGLEELKTKLTDGQIFIGVFRVRAIDQFGSRRTKFVYLNYVGVGVATLRAARATTHKYDFERLFHGYHVQIYVNSKDELTQEIIVDLLQASAGAHKPQFYEFS